MQPRILLPVLFLYVTLSGAGLFSEKQESGFELQLPIAHVQLFSDQALVERKGVLPLAAGRKVFVVPRLSEKLIDSSVKIFLPEGSSLRIDKIEVLTANTKNFKSQEARDAEENLKQAESHLRRLTEEYQASKRDRNFYAGLTLAPIPKKSSKTKWILNAGHWRLNLDMIQQALQRLDSTLEALLPQVDNAREMLAIRLAVAERYRSQAMHQEKKIVVTFRSEVSANVPITLQYRIRGANWYPAYSIRVHDKLNENKVELISYALIKNETGEDWPEMRLSFSAADPNESAVLPDLDRWLISARTVPTPEYSKSRSRNGSSFFDFQSNQKPAAYAPRESRKRSYAKDDFIGGSYKEKSQTRINLRHDEELLTQTQSSNSYLAENMRSIQDNRAQRKSAYTRKNIDDLQTGIRAQEQALKQGRFDQVLSNSDTVILSIQKMAPEHRKFFQNELSNAYRLKKKTLAFMESQKLVSRVISPVQSSRGYDYRYLAALPESIASDGSFHKILVQKQELGIQLYYEVAPREKPLAFLAGSVQYSGDNPLLAGPLSVFHGNDYVGEAKMENTSAGVSFRVHLGADEDVKITRQEKEFRVTSGVFSTTYTYQKDISIQVKNQKKREIKLYLYDRLPVAGNDLVKISDIEVSPEAINKTKTGIYQFEFNMKPGQKENIRLKYHLSYDQGVLPYYRTSSYNGW